MAIDYGKSMAITGEDHVFGWMIEHYDQLTPAVMGTSGGAFIHYCGNEYWKGEYNVYAQTTRFVNDSFTFVASPVNTGSKSFSGTALCSEIEITDDPMQSTYIETTVRFHSASTLASAAASATDTAIPAVLCDKGLGIDFAGSAVDNVSYRNLRMFCEPIAYVNSSTDGVVYHAAAPVNAICTWRVDSDDPANIPAEGTQGIVNFYMTDSTYWELTWMRIMGVRPFQVTRDGKRLVQFQVIAMLDFSDGTSLGTIKDPTGATKWPV